MAPPKAKVKPTMVKVSPLDTTNDADKVEALGGVALSELIHGDNPIQSARITTTAKYHTQRSRARLAEMPNEIMEKEELNHGMRFKMLLWLNSKWVTLLLTAVVLFSMSMVFASMFGVVFGSGMLSLENWIMGFFGAETLVRLILMGPKAYFTNWMCLCDFMVSAIDLTMFLVTEFSTVDNPEALNFFRIVRVSRLAKVTRLSRLIANIEEETGNTNRGAEVEKDEDGHIWQYNSASLFAMGWLHNLAGTVVSMPEIWVQSLMLVIVTTLLAALTCPMKCDSLINSYDPLFVAEGGCVNCVTSIAPDFGLMFLGLAAFLLGIFAQMLFDRWWQLRQTIEALFAEITDTAMLTLAFLRGQDPKSTAIRRDVIRWSKLGAYLLEKQIDGKRNYRNAIKWGFLTEREWDCLENRDDNFMLPQQWAMDALCQAKDKGLISEYGGTFDSLIMTFPAQRKLCTDILMFLNTPIPYIFTHLMTVICKVNLLFTGIACGTMVGQAIEQEQWLAVFIGYMIVILGNMLVEGLLRLHVVLSDPFGDDACDFPWDMMMHTMNAKINMLVAQFGRMHLAEEGEVRVQLDMIPTSRRHAFVPVPTGKKRDDPDCK